MLFSRVFFCSLTVLVAVAHAEPVTSPPPAAAASPTLTEPTAETPRPERHRGLKIALGVLGGAVLIGAIVGIGVANASSGSSNQTGYNNWGTLVLMRR